MQGSLTIGRVFGISIGLHYSWFIVFGLLVWSLSSGYFPMEHPHWSVGVNWTVGAVSTLLLFGSVLVHELSHSLVAKAKGMPVKSITLFIFGGVSNLREEPDTAPNEFLIAIVGPASSVGLAIFFALVWLISQPVSPVVSAIANYLAYINAALAAFNLVPGFPLDGGRVLRSLVWWIKKDLVVATEVASRAGRAVAYLLIFAGFLTALSGNWTNGLWLLFIGWFLSNAAESTQRQVMLQDILRAVPIDRLITREFDVVEPDLTLESLVHDHVLRHHWREFPVESHGRLVGIITLTDLKAVPRDQWSLTSVREAMTKAEDLKTVSFRDDGLVAFKRLAESNVNQLLVVDGGTVIGLVNRESILAFIEMRSQLGRATR
jgi:Zn-dependent protease/CBS domain-containing protein